jgi:hypothetical protein
MDINAIKINQKNPRFIKNDNFYKLVKSVKEFPAMLKYRPIIVDNDNIIIGGNMRYLALKELGYTEIKDEWVKKASEFTAEEIKRFIIEDNLQFGEWDWDIIVDEGWNIDELIDWGMEMKRFKKIEGYEKEFYEEFEDDEQIEITLNISKKYFDEVYSALKDMITKNTARFDKGIDKKCENFLFFCKASWDAMHYVEFGKKKNKKYALYIPITVGELDKLINKSSGEVISYVKNHLFSNER